MTATKARCLLLACGNSLRGDDGIAPWLADWAQQRFENDPRLTIISRQQWTPELAADIADCDAVLFVDCSIESEPGSVMIRDVQPTNENDSLGTHQVTASQLLGLARGLYASQPRRAQLLTIGAAATELSEEFSPAVLDSIPMACAQMEKTITQFLNFG